MSNNLWNLNPQNYQTWQSFSSSGPSLTLEYLECFRNECLYGKHLTNKEMRLEFIPEGKIKRVLYG